MCVPFALLLFAIPIPQIIFNKIAFPLQIYASQMAIWGIRLFEVPSIRKAMSLRFCQTARRRLSVLKSSKRAAAFAP
jgi:hypothetical protein